MAFISTNKCISTRNLNITVIKIITVKFAQYSTAQVKESKNFIPNIGVLRTLGIKPSKRNIQQTQIASPPKACVMRSYARLLGMVILYTKAIFLAK